MKHITQFDSIHAFTTKRLRAQKITEQDFSALVELHSNEQVMQYLGGTKNPDEMRAHFDWLINHWHMHGFGLWLFYTLDSNEWIGIGGLKRSKIQGAHETEILYELLPQFWQQGYATEITHACMEIAFEVLRLGNIVGFTQITDEPTRRVMEKAGFEYEKDFIHRGHANALYRLQSYRKADVLPYDDAWPDLYEQEAIRIKNLLGDAAIATHHIGSTAIPNMPAKPIIDIILELDDITAIGEAKEKLREISYRYLRRQVVPHHTYFTNKKVNNIGYNLHIAERGNPQIKRHILFKDYLSDDAQLAGSYAELKIKLASEFRDDINAYVTSKDKLVQAIDNKAKLWEARKRDFTPANTSRNAQQDIRIISQAMQANLNMYMTHFAQYIPDVDLVRIPGHTLVNANLPDDTFNYVIDADFTEAGADQAIEKITDYFRDRELPFSWWVSPDDKPDNLSTYLVKHGYQHAEKNVGMYLDLHTLKNNHRTPKELTIKRVLDKKGMHDFAMVLTNNDEAFSTYFSWVAEVLTDDDPIEYYVGYVDNKPVTRGLLALFGGVAGLHMLSTSPDERNKGYASAMQHFRLMRAKELGYNLAVLQASVQGYPLYKKLGYQECGDYHEYKLPSI